MTLRHAINEIVRKWAEAAQEAPNKNSNVYVRSCALCRFAGNPIGAPYLCGFCPVVEVFGKDPNGLFGCHEFVATDGTTTDALMSVLFLAAALGVEVEL